MQLNLTVWVALFLALAVLATMLFLILRKKNARTIDQIAIGETSDRPVVTFKKLTSAREYEMATPVDETSISIDRLSALCGPLPSLLAAGEMAGKHLMEVVINGDLVRAADGNGFRAFSMAANQIDQQALLFKASKLQQMINVAAIWQIASVVVAQKHLVDISDRLNEIQDKIQGISKFLYNQRKSVLVAAYGYLDQVYQAIQGGEFPGAVRNQLEQYERDLLEIQHQLETEYREKAEKRVPDEELFGIAGVTAGIAAKLDDLDQLTDDIALCVKTRIAVWHVLSLFPGEQQLKLARRESIKNSIEKIQALAPDCKEKVNAEISKVYAYFVGKETLDNRKKQLADKCDSTVLTLSQTTQQLFEAIERSDQLLLKNDSPTRILLLYDNGAFVGARQG